MPLWRKGSSGRNRCWQLNPAFEDGGTDGEELAEQGLMHPDCADIFKEYRLYRHQREAIGRGLREQSFVVTSGTGSGKSLTYIGTIFNHLLENPDTPSRSGRRRGLSTECLGQFPGERTQRLCRKFENKRRGVPFPIRFAKFTGQARRRKNATRPLWNLPPHILLTNYMMLELLLTLVFGKGGTATGLREALFENSEVCRFGRIRTPYWGRQGADVGPA